MLSKQNLVGLTIIFILIFSNPWIYVIYRNNPILASLIGLITLLLFLTKIFKQKTYIFIFILLSILVLLLLRTGFDSTIFSKNPTEVKQLNTRHEFYNQDLGFLFTNKYSLNYYQNYSLSVLKLNRNLFYNLDPNLYFFASHPREKAGINEFEKFSAVYLPFFIIGLFSIIFRKNYKWLKIYSILTILISAFLIPTFPIGPILFFPIVLLLIENGLLQILTYFKII